MRARLPLAQPRWTYIFLAVNLVFFLGMTLLGLLNGLGLSGSESGRILLTSGAQQNLLVAQGDFWRLLTSMFIHIGYLHLAFNSYALWVLGKDVERLYGTARFFLIYLLSGLGGSLAYFALGDNVLSAGASGAIFGLIGTEIAFFWQHRDKFGQRQLVNVLMLAVFNLFLGATIPGINNIAHLGGLVTGFALGWLLVPDYARPSVDVLEADGSLVLQDRSSLQRRLPGVAAVILVLVLLGAAGVARWNQLARPAELDAAVELLDTREDQAAAGLLRPLAEQRPEDGVTLFYLGVAEARLGNMDAAQRAWVRSAELRPDIAGTHWNLALLYARQGRDAEATTHLETFSQLAETDAERAQAERMLRQLGG